MLKRGKRFVPILLGLVLSVLSTGCGKEPEEKVEITLMHGWGGNLDTHKTMQSIYEDFEKNNPDIILNCIPYSDSSIAVEKANDMLAVEKMPDIISTNGLSYYVQNAVKRDMALDLMPYIQEDEEFKAMIHPSVYENWETAEGHLYTIPDALEVAGYWYNKNYMKAAGLTDANGEVQEPETWEEFLAMTEQLAKWTDESGEDICVCALDQLQKVEFLFPARLAGEGTDGYSSVNRTSARVDANVLEPVMRDIGTICARSRTVENIENARQEFMDGKSVIYFNGIWESKSLMEKMKQDDIGYSAYPCSNSQKLAYISVSSGYVLAKQKNAKKEEACIRFLKYMLSREVQQKLVVSTGQMPSNPEIDRSEIWKENPVLADAIDKMYGADVQIKMIRSVWPESRVNIVEKYIEQGKYGAEDVGKMAAELAYCE